MPVYKVGKSKHYRDYLYECLRVMFAADVYYFTLADLSEWSGLPVSTSMRKYLDYLALEGAIHVVSTPLVASRSGRTYNLNSIAWFGVVPPA